jgi:hypothetical protein
MCVRHTRHMKVAVECMNMDTNKLNKEKKRWNNKDILLKINIYTQILIHF